MKKVTIQEVAECASVSKSTVSQYINNRYEFMAPATKLRIAAAIKELGYIPNYAAKGLRQKKSSTIGVIVANILHAFSTEVIRSIEDECGRNGFHLFVCNADDQPEKERAYIDMLLAKQVDGLIIIPTNGNNDYYAKLKQENFPIVFVDRKINDSIYPTLLFDNESASQMAVERLVQKGKKKIGLISTSIEQQVTPRIERINGFRKTLDRFGIALDEKWVIAEERTDLIEKLQQTWETGGRPDAFFATNDLSLIELLKFIKQKHLAVPGDLSVIAIDDNPFLDIVTTPVTVIKQPTFEIGKDATQTLLKLIETKIFKPYYNEKRYAPVLVERESI